MDVDPIATAMRAMEDRAAQLKRSLGEADLLAMAPPLDDVFRAAKRMGVSEDEWKKRFPQPTALYGWALDIENPVKGYEGYANGVPVLTAAALRVIQKMAGLCLVHDMTAAMTAQGSDGVKFVRSFPLGDVAGPKFAVVRDEPRRSANGGVPTVPKEQYFLQTPTGTTVSLMADPRTKIYKVKEAAARKEYRAFEHIRLSYAGHILDDRATLQECGILPQGTLHAVVWIPFSEKD